MTISRFSVIKLMIINVFQSKKMNFTMKKYLEPDSKWELFGDKSGEEYLENTFKNLWLTNRAPEGIKESFAVAEHMLALSYFNYTMFDDGVFKLTIIFEMALRMEFETLPEAVKISLRPKPSRDGKIKEPSFDRLATYFVSKGYFDSPKSVLNDIRDIRNHWAHPHRHSFAAAALMQKMNISIDLINEFYEDRELRETRVRLLEETNKKIAIFHNKLCLLKQNDITIPITGVASIFVNNKVTPAIYSIAFVPMIDLEPYFHDKHYIPQIIKCELREPIISENEIAGIDLLTNSSFELVINEEPFFEEIYAKWKAQFNKLESQFLIGPLINSEAFKFYLETKRRFLRLGNI